MGEQKHLVKIAVVLCSLVLAACAKPSRINYKKSAPTEESELGLLYKATSADKVEDLQVEYDGVELRPLNERHLMYEVHGISQEQLKAFDSDAVVQKNKIYVLKKDSEKEEPSLKQQVDDFIKKCNNPTSLIRTPLMVMTPPQHDSSFDVNQVIHIANEEGTVMARTLWVVDSPTGSDIEAKPKNTRSLQFFPDMGGVYTVYQLAEDAAGNCYNTSGTLSVTANPDYNRIPGQEVDDIVANSFYQLGAVEAPRAWKQSKGEEAIIAIIDTGVNYNHPSLSPNMLTNKGEIPNNNIDDDDNGLVDDYIGYDFVFNDGKPFDDAGHGSHVAGLAAAYEFGVAPRAKILAIKAMSPLGTGDLGSIAAAIFYAVDRGSDVINLSLSYEGEPQPLLNLAIKHAERNGVVIVAAAGNGDFLTGIGYSLNDRPNYPANYGYSNVITVAASAKQAMITKYSNYSNDMVDVIAPGGSHQYPLISAYVENPKGYGLSPSQGTSMAAPVVAGVIALMRSLAPNMKPSQVRELLLTSGPTHPDLRPLVASSRALNANDAVTSTLNHLQNTPTVAAHR